ncbi:MAG: oligosaccharide flippase family protein [Lachnospirales bacterium]
MVNNKKNNITNTMVSQGLILIIANIIVRFFGFIYRIPLTDMLGDSGNGIYSASFNVYYFFLLISSASMPAVISKLVSERTALKQYKDAHNVYKVAYFISGTLGFLCMLILFFNADKVEDLLYTEGTALSIKVLAPTVFCVSLLSVYRGYFQGLKNTIPTAISQVVEQIVNAIVSLIGAYYLVKISVAHGAAGSTLGTLFGAFSGLIVVFIIYLSKRKFIMKKVSKSFASESYISLGKQILKTSIPIILGTTIFAITNIIDTRMSMSRLTASGVFTYDEAVSLYGQLTGKFLVLTNLPISIATVFSASVIPNISSMRIAKKKKDINKNINLAIKMVMIFAVPATFGMVILAKEIYAFLYPSYPAGYTLMYLGGISIIIISFNQVIVSILQGLDRLYLPLISTLVSVIIKITLNYFLISIPSINIHGAVISTVVSYMVFLILDLYFLKRVWTVKIKYKSVFLKPLIASVIMGIVCFFTNKAIFFIFKSNAIALIMSVIISMFVYFIILITIRSITDKDILRIPKGYLILKILQKIKII